eukprot:m.241381 g.241381  ORF g.241381 m.241381 type:complete len:77 (+) comp26586_c0_seq6:3-233(+)
MCVCVCVRQRVEMTAMMQFNFQVLSTKLFEGCLPKTLSSPPLPNRKEVGSGVNVKVHRLRDPIRGQGTLNFPAENA